MSTVVVTGGGGIGYATALRLGRANDVILGDVNGERLRRTLGALRAESIHATGVVCDVTDESAVAELAGLARDRGDFTALVHTAGVSTSMTDARTILKVNFLGTTLVLGAFIPLLRDGAAAICIASIVAHRRRASEFDGLLADARAPGAIEALVDAARNESRLAYVLSKRGIVLLCQRLAAPLAEQGARIVTISPGVVDTEMGRLEISGVGGAAAAASMAALGRIATPDEIAGVAEVLCGPIASYVTGCDLVVDGGTLSAFRHHASAEARSVWDDPWK